jgi:hypothetical protein
MLQREGNATAVERWQRSTAVLELLLLEGGYGEGNLDDYGWGGLPDVDGGEWWGQEARMEEGLREALEAFWPGARVEALERLQGGGRWVCACRDMWTGEGRGDEGGLRLLVVATRAWMCARGQRIS